MNKLLKVWGEATAQERKEFVILLLKRYQPLVRVEARKLGLCKKEEKSND